MDTVENKLSDWIYGIWFVGDNESVDFLAQLRREEGVWKLEYRFRYYDKSDPGNDAFSGKDRKSHYTVTAIDGSDEMRDKLADALRKILKLVELRYGNKADFVHLDCAPDDPKLFFELGSRPWAHIKQGAEAEAYLAKLKDAE